MFNYMFNLVRGLQVIDFHQTMEVNGIRFWCYTAGHVLGAAMFMVDIAGTRVLYTGDYSCEEDRHLRAAEMPQFSPDVCIIESTYGVQIHQPRVMRERRFTDIVASTVSQVWSCNFRLHQPYINHFGQNVVFTCNGIYARCLLSPAFPTRSRARADSAISVGCTFALKFER